MVENGYQVSASSENTPQENMENSPILGEGHDDDSSSYTISSVYWCPPELSHRPLSWDEIQSVEQTAIRRDAVLAVYSKVYAIAKVVSAICKNYGVTVCS